MMKDGRSREAERGGETVLRRRLVNLTSYGGLFRVAAYFGRRDQIHFFQEYCDRSGARGERSRT